MKEMKVYARALLSMITAVFLAVFVSACASLWDANPESTYIKQEIASGQAVKVIENDQMNDLDKQIVQHAVNQFNTFKTKWRSVIDNPDMIATVSQNELLSDYMGLRDRYAEVNLVVQKNWGNYDVLTQQKLLEYRDYAINLDRKIGQFINMRESAKAAKEALMWVATVASVVAKVR